MKKIFKMKSMAIALLITILISVLSLVSCGLSPIELYDWEISDDESMVWNEDREYYRYDLPIGYKVDFRPSYYFEGDWEAIIYNVESYARDGEIIALYSSYASEEYYYATDVGKASIDALIAGNYESLKLYYEYCTSDIGIDTLELLGDLDISGAPGREIDVSELRYLERYDVRAYDSTGCVYYVHGALYEYEGATWYVNYDKLSNNHFDANGNFSYRNGTVTMYPIYESTVLGRKIEDAKGNLTEIDDSFIYEEDDLASDDEQVEIDPELSAKIWFWAVYVIVAFALPAWPLAVGFVNSCSPKHGRDKWWRMVSLGSLIWIIFGIAIMLILIFG